MLLLGHTDRWDRVRQLLQSQPAGHLRGEQSHQGLDRALQLMPVGSKWQLFIPPNLAYGATGSGRRTIGPNATPYPSKANPEPDDETRQPGRRCERSAPHQWRARYSPRQGAGMTLNLYLLCVIAGRTGSHVVLFNVSERLYIRRRVLELARARGEMQ